MNMKADAIATRILSHVIMHEFIGRQARGFSVAFLNITKTLAW